MSDDSSGEEATRRLTVTAKEFIRFGEAKNLQRACVECGDDRWAFALEGDDEQNPDAIVQLALIPAFNSKRSIPVHTMLCMSCGITKIINAAIVRDWVDNNG